LNTQKEPTTLLKANATTLLCSFHLFLLPLLLPIFLQSKTAMSTVALEPLFHLCSRKPSFHSHKPIPLRPFFLPTCSSNLNDASFIFHHQPRRTLSPLHAASVTDTPTLHPLQCPQTITYTFAIDRTQMVSTFPSNFICLDVCDMVHR